MEYLMRHDAAMEAGFNNPDLLVSDPTLASMSLEQFQLQLVLNRATKVEGWLPVEAALLLEGKMELDEKEFKRSIRRINSGIRILCGKAREAYAEGRVLVLTTNFVHQEAFGPGVFVESLAELEQAINEKRASGVTPFVLCSTLKQRNILLSSFRKKLTADAPLPFEVMAWEHNVFLAARESDMTAERLAMALGGTSEGSVAVIKYGKYCEFRFDFQAGTIDNGLRTYIVKRNLVAPQFAEMVDIKTFFALRAIDLGRVTTQKSAEAILQASGMSHFVTDDGGYAYMPEDRKSYGYYQVLQNEVGIVRLTCKSGFSLRISVDDTHTSEDIVTAMKILGDRGHRVAMKAQGSGLLVDNGALVRHHGLVAGTVLIGTDAGKPGKLFNRGKLDARAIAQTIDEFGNSTIVQGGLAIKDKDGNPMFLYGTAIEDVMVTNSGWGPGSGVAVVPTSFRRRIRLIKTVRGTIPAIKIETVGKNLTRDKKVEALRDAVLKDLVVETGMLEHGDVAFSYQGLPYGVFRGQGMEAKVVGKPAIRVAASSETVAVSVKVEVTFWYTCHKVSMQGLKATLIPSTISVVDASSGEAINQPQLFVTNEERKGNIDLVYYWAHSVTSILDEALTRGWITQEDHDRGYVLYDVELGLTQAQAAAKAKYEADNLVMIDVTWHDINDDHLELADALIKASSNGVPRRGITAEEFCKNNDYICNIEVAGESVIERNVSAIRYHRAIVGIELSTVLENMGRSGLTGEQILHLHNLSSQLGNVLWEEAFPIHDAVEHMQDMANGVYLDSAAVVYLDQPAFEHNLEKGARQIIEYYAKKYPDGIVFVKDDKVVLNVMFDTFLKIGALLDGGSCTGIALELIRFLNWMHVSNAGTSGFQSMAKRYADIVREGIVSWASSAKRLLGLVTRGHSSAVLTAKVKTTHSRTINRGEVGVNPNHPSVRGWLHKAKEMGYTIPDNLEGFVLPQFAVYERTPMTSFAGGHIKLTDEAELGVFLISGLRWAQSNEGDGDGDSSPIVVVSNPLMVREVKANISSSPFGPSGYEIAHGYELALQPYAAFFMGNAKKDLSKPEVREHKLTEMPLDEYVAAANREVKHYTGFMGTTYAISSYLTYMSGKAKDTGCVTGDALEALHKANVIAERRIYEGLALSGVSDDGDEAAADILDIVRMNRIEVRQETRARLIASGAYDAADFSTENIHNRTHHFIDGVAAVQLMFEKLGFVDRGVAFWLHRAILVTGMYSILERKAGEHDDREASGIDRTIFISPKEAVSKAPHLAQDDIIEDAVVFGMIRRGSQGVSMNRGASEAGRGLFRHVTDAHIVNLGSGIVADTASNVRRVQTKLNALKDRMAAEENNNPFGL